MWNDPVPVIVGRGGGRERGALGPSNGWVVNDLMHLVDGQHFRQRLDVVDFHLRERLPVASAGASVKELDAAEGHSQ